MSELPAAASTALRATLTSPAPRAGRVLAAFPSAVYVRLDAPAPDEPAVLALVTSDGTRLPNAMVVAAPAGGGPFRDVRRGDAAAVGGGAVRLPALRVATARWWDPRPALGSPPVGADPDRAGAGAHQPEESGSALLRRTVGVLAEAVAAWPSAVADRLQPLTLAVAADHGPAAQAAAGDLIGRGPGLTPAGDDVLAGTLATLALLQPDRQPGAVDPTFGAVRTQSGRGGSATGARAGLERAIAELAAARTTALSAALLHCARRGQVAAPAADLLRALTGDLDVPATARALLRVGHSSGRDLAAGILLAAGCVAAGAAAEAVA